MKKKLALGNQEFSKVINNNCIYVDKTKDIYKLILKGDYYFLSRPRRFGKSLLCNTLKELFLGNKELFKGLWIYDKWDWKTTYPVIKISFSNISHKTFGLEKAINVMLDDTAKKYNIKYTHDIFSYKFQELIIKLSKKNQVVIIIDEYDKPIIDYMNDFDQAEKNRDILKSFYSILKDSDKYIKFLFITGVSKFSQVSIFSDLNNLIDITIGENYSKIVGWTKQEVEKYFQDYLKNAAEKYKNIFSDIMLEIQKWYNGYSWDGITKVYNPVSLMNFFDKLFFGNFWFATGTPTMLLDLIRNKKFTAFDIENTYISTKILDNYNFKKINLISLLFQTGYLTIKEFDIATGDLMLSYPNKEVASAFSLHILSEFSTGQLDQTDSLLYKIRKNILNNEIEEFIEHLNILFENISNIIVHKTEKYFHSLFYLVIKMLGFNIEAEILTIKNRIDAVLKTETHIFIIEFKINQSAEKAIQQIKDKKYALKYADDKRIITLLGINFDTKKKIIEDWKKNTQNVIQ